MLMDPGGGSWGALWSLGDDAAVMSMSPARNVHHKNGIFGRQEMYWQMAGLAGYCVLPPPQSALPCGRAPVGTCGTCIAATAREGADQVERSYAGGNPDSS